MNASPPRRPGHRGPGSWLAGLLLALSTLALAIPVAAQAQAQTQAQAQAQAQQAPADPTVVLDQARDEMAKVRAAEEKPMDDAANAELRRRALAVQTRAEEAAAALAPQLAEVKAQLTELGEPAAGVKESPDVAAQRSQLMRSVSTIDSQIKLARVLAVEAAQTAASVSAARRLQFNARLGERAPSFLGGQYWSLLRQDAQRDALRASQLAADAQSRLAGVSAGRWLALAVTVIGVLLVHVLLQRTSLRVSTTRVPSGRLRRSAHALGLTLVWTLTLGLIAHATRVTVVSGPGPTPALEQWLVSIEAIVWFGGFVGGLLAALLMPRKPSWRLPPVPDAVAARLWWLPVVFATAVVLGSLSNQLVTLLDASRNSLVLVKGLGALTFACVLALALRQATRPAPAADVHAKAARPRLPLSLSIARFVAWVVIGGSAVAVLAGFVALGSFAMSQLVWGSILLCVAYLLSVLVDDLLMALMPRTTHGTASDAESAAAAEDPVARASQQAAVLLSGALRVVIGFFALILLLAPFGEGPLELLSRAGRIEEGLAIGALSVQPIALARAAMVLLLGWIAVRLLKTWLVERFLPTSRMDEGMRLSVTTLFGYIGLVVVVALALSAAGLGLERVAWVASALSVGIGFGLQAVVQNFVSGLILLAERPVKVGDWVSLSGVEGDIRRINVRATEIQMGDRSTVIVPNSEFITKIVRNVTYGDSLGMVQFKLPLPLATDVERVRDIMLAAFEAHPAVLPTPPAKVQLEGVDGANFVINASGFVNSPRAASAIKSDLLFEVLARLRQAGLLVAA